VVRRRKDESDISACDERGGCARARARGEASIERSTSVPQVPGLRAEYVKPVARGCLDRGP